MSFAILLQEQLHIAIKKGCKLFDLMQSNGRNLNETAKFFSSTKWNLLDIEETAGGHYYEIVLESHEPVTEQDRTEFFEKLNQK